MFRNLLLLALISLGSHTFADCSEIACSGIGSEVIKSVYPNSSGHIYLQANIGKENLDCTLVEGHYMVLQSDHPVFEEAYSTVLTALVSQKTLTVRIKTGSPNCEVSYVRMFM